MKKRMKDKFLKTKSILIITLIVINLALAGIIIEKQKVIEKDKGVLYNLGKIISLKWLFEAGAPVAITSISCDGSKVVDSNGNVITDCAPYACDSSGACKTECNSNDECFSYDCINSCLDADGKITSGSGPTMLTEWCQLSECDLYLAPCEDIACVPYVNPTYKKCVDKMHNGAPERHGAQICCGSTGGIIDPNSGCRMDGLQCVTVNGKPGFEVIKKKIGDLYCKNNDVYQKYNLTDCDGTREIEELAEDCGESDTYTEECRPHIIKPDTGKTPIPVLGVEVANKARWKKERILRGCKDETGIGKCFKDTEPAKLLQVCGECQLCEVQWGISKCYGVKDMTKTEDCNDNMINGLSLLTTPPVFSDYYCFACLEGKCQHTDCSDCPTCSKKVDKLSPFLTPPLGPDNRIVCEPLEKNNPDNCPGGQVCDGNGWGTNCRKPCPNGQSDCDSCHVCSGAGFCELRGGLTPKPLGWICMEVEPGIFCDPDGNSCTPENPAPPTTPSVSTSSSGGGSSSSYASSVTISSTQLTSTSGVTKTFTPEQTVNVQLPSSTSSGGGSGTETHTISATVVNNNQATIIITSTPQQKTLSVGDEWKVDVDNDGIYDLLVKLEKIQNNKPVLSMKAINETAVQNESFDAAEEVVEQVETPQPTAQENPKFDKSLVILAIVVMIICIILLIWKPWKGKTKRR